jgi:hypothetical protein
MVIMPNTTDDIEFEVRIALSNGPLTLDGLEAGGRFAWLDDRCWLDVAISNLVRDGRVTSSCDWSHHNHNGGCVIEAVAR